MTKTKQKKTHVVFILDASGSMAPFTQQTLSGFNEYVDTLKTEHPENINMTLTLFNDQSVDVVYTDKPLQDIPKLDGDTYRPNALTPLYDAIGRTINSAARKVASDDNVLVVIMTDGEENCSKEYTREQIFNTIKELEGKNWTFTYLGANQDAWAVGQQFGMQPGNVRSYNMNNVGRTMRAMRGVTVGYAGQSVGSHSDLLEALDEEVLTGDNGD